MSEAFDRVLRGKKRKKCRQGRYLLAHREEVIAELTAKLANGSFRLGSYHERIICENGKVRHLQILSMYDRIAVYAVINVVDQHLHKRFIRTTGASIKKRGTHDLRKCMQLDMERDPEGTRYCYEFDIKHFYDNTKPEFVMWCYRRVFKDKTLLSLLDHFLHLLPEGISFGLRSSQPSGNLLLSVFLDHYLKTNTASAISTVIAMTAECSVATSKKIGWHTALYMSKSKKLTLKSRRTKGYSRQRKESTFWGM